MTTHTETADTAGKPDRVSREDVADLARRIMDEVPGLVALDLSRHVAGHVTLSMIRSAEYHSGAGEAAMRLLTAWADAHGVTLAATPEPSPLPGQRRMNKARLRSWYVRHGFATNRGRRGRDFTIIETMLRRPRTPQAG